ncbi:MAG TPA: hypothetical protein VNI78_08650, partial [Vicinamibacterales bacterium]|nr:hypothetical protein [Vicinamibacterales bacterium]
MDLWDDSLRQPATLRRATTWSNEVPLQLKIHGLDCAEEVAILKREVGPVVGGESRLGFDILRGRMTVDAPSGV